MIRFKHNDAADLDKRLARLAGTEGDKIIVVEGIYSMLGDQAPLAEIVDVKKKHGAYIILDEAHSMGVLGETWPRPGGSSRRRGRHRFRRRHLQQEPGRHRRLLRLRSSGVQHPARRLPALHVHGLAAALHRRLGDGGAEGDGSAGRSCARSLWANVNTLYDGLKRHGFVLGPQKGPVVAVHLPSPEIAVRLWHALLQAGVYVNLALPPATPNGTALLRCSVCAAHTKAQLDSVVAKLTDVAYQGRSAGRAGEDRRGRLIAAFSYSYRESAAAIEPPGEAGCRQQRMAPLPIAWPWR